MGFGFRWVRGVGGISESSFCWRVEGLPVEGSGVAEVVQNANDRVRIL